MIKGITKGANLVDVTTANSIPAGSGYGNYTIDDTNHTVTSSGDAKVGFIAKVEPNTQYTVKAVTSNKGFISVSEFDSLPTEWEGSNFIKRDFNDVITNSPYTFTTTANTQYVLVGIYVGIEGVGSVVSQIMLNAGSSPLPYEPYQVAHDITRIPMRGKNLFFNNTTKTTSAANASIVQTKGSSEIEIVSKQTTQNDASATLNVNFALSAGTYTLSEEGLNSFERNLDRIFLKDTDGNIYGNNTQYNIPQTFTIEDDVIIDRISVVFAARSTYTDKRIKIMLNAGSQALPYEPYGMQPGWEVRDQQGTILWAADKTLTGTASIPIKGYGLPLTDYKVEADMTVPATQEYSIEGTSSIDYQSDGTALTDLEFQGNMVQSGTPSSSSPIYPSEMGERTINQFDYKTVYSSYIDANGNISTKSNNVTTWNSFTADQVGKTLTISMYAAQVSSSYIRVQGQINGEYVTGDAITANNTGFSQITVTPTSTSDRWRITYGTGSFDIVVNQVMVAEGSTRQTYEPYGYKIPFSNGQTSYNVYLTEPLRKIGDYADKVESDGTVTRRVRKFVVTSDKISSFNAGLHRIGVSVYASVSSDAAICSHYKVQVKSDGSFEHMYLGSNNTYIFIFDPSFETQTDATNFLDAQYAAGTPVTVWYVLATEQTDTVTFPTVTPAQGANTLSVSTTLVPSKTRLTATSGVWPKNPIWPVEFGEKTAQLIPEIVQGGVNANNGNLSTSSNRVRTNLIAVEPGQTYTVSAGNMQISSAAYYTNGTYYGSLTQSSAVTKTFTVPNDANQVAIGFRNDEGTDITPSDISGYMLNAGSQPLPYEPYGKYKIPITCGGNTYNVFTTAPLRKIGPHADYEQLSVGEGRKIYKLVLDGTENFYGAYDTGYSRFSITLNGSLILGVRLSPAMSTHYQVISDGRTIGNVPNNSIYSDSGNSRWFIKTVDYTVLTAFKAWLADEYAAGHPVTIWYVLATEKTTPTQLPTITPTDGNDTFAVNTTVPPSAVTITGHVKARTT